MDVTFCAPAKLNLFFEVCHHRADGYHEIDSLVVPISLEDELAFHAHVPAAHRSVDETAARQETTEKLGTVESFGTNATRPSAELPPIRLESSEATLPCDERNLIVRAIRRYGQHVGWNAAWTIHLTKRIPMEAGLGGGSSDAAAALLAAERCSRWFHPEFPALSDTELAAMGAELGSDVPLFFAGGAVRCRGRGEILEKIADPPEPLHMVLIKPPEGLSTAMVYRHCTPGDQSGDLRSITPFLSAFATGDPEQIGRFLFNRLAIVAQSESAAVRLIFERLSRETTCGFGMSGSGTCCFALCRNANHAADLAVRLEKTPWFVQTVQTKNSKILEKKV
ncbi:MAG: hypothetical protein PHE53_11475 [Thermoguttaceae bacterium]|nr:hypothetical protein [Thermoguttaceae bacterium]